MSRRSSVCGPALVALLAIGCGGLGDYSKYLDSGEPDEEALPGTSGGSAGASDTGFTSGSGGGSGSGSAGSDGGDTTGGSAGDDGSSDGGDDGTTAPITIAVTAVSPDYGSTSGGDTVVIDGGPFDDTTRVFIGRTEATVLSYTESTITVATPSMSAAGTVAVEVESDAGSGSLRSAFTYWLDGTGQYGMIGYVEVARYTGSYWTPSVPADEYFAQLYFTDPTTYRWHDLIVPTLDTCRSETWTSTPTITVFTAGVPQIYLRPTSGSTLELNLDGFAYLADPSSLTTGARYTLLAPTGGDLPNVDVADIVQLPSSGPSVSSPAITGSSPPFISQYETFRWTPGGADWVELSMILENGYTADGYEVVTCAVYDDGSFTFDGSQFASWPSNAQAIISVGFVYDQSTTPLPWNRSTSAVAGVTKTVGGAFTY